MPSASARTIACSTICSTVSVSGGRLADRDRRRVLPLSVRQQRLSRHPSVTAASTSGPLPGHGTRQGLARRPSPPPSSAGAAVRRSTSDPRRATIRAPRPPRDARSSADARRCPRGRGRASASRGGADRGSRWVRSRRSPLLRSGRSGWGSAPGEGRPPPGPRWPAGGEDRHEPAVGRAERDWVDVRVQRSRLGRAAQARGMRGSGLMAKAARGHGTRGSELTARAVRGRGLRGSGLMARAGRAWIAAQGEGGAHGSQGASARRRSGTRESGSTERMRRAASGPAAARVWRTASRRRARRIAAGSASRER